MIKSSLHLFILLGVLHSNLAINSYIYLPDKYVQEEIPIGSLIVDISEEIAKYNELNKQNSNLNTDSFIDSSENLHYTFLNDVKSSTENTYFLLDSITGRATSKRYLDRESMCLNKHCMDTCDLGNQNNFVISNSTYLNLKSSNKKTSETVNPPGNCKLNLKVLIIPSYSIVSLNVILQDINDNKPQFRVEFMNQSIPENVPIGYKIPIDLAYDPDIGINSIQTYSLIQSANINKNALFADTDKPKNEQTFKLTQDESQLALVVQQKLDREKVSQYNLTIIACDGGGTQSNCGHLKLLLNLVDINDHNPIFYKESYSFSIMENMPKDTYVGQIKAYDLDSDLNGKVKYRIIGISNSAETHSPKAMPGPQQNYFRLNEDTGVLSLSAPLDYENEQVFSLNVEARDCGVGSLPAYATIEINVIDTNDNPPEISVSFLNSIHRNYSTSSIQEQEQKQSGNVSMLNVYMSENTEANKFIAHVSIFDRDSVENGQLDWKVYVNEKLISSNDMQSRDDQLLSISKLNSNSFTINTGLKSDILFDRERIPSINVSVQSFDHGTVPKTNMAFFNFSIVLLDINDNGPKFEKKIYDDLYINENNQLNQFIFKFNALDLDANQNAKITYSIDLNSNEKYVYIDSATGVLRASKVFDREERDVYEFFVNANDNCEQIELRKSAKVKCVLRIKDLNDNKPQINYNSTSLPFREYSNQTSLILRLDENIPGQTQLVKFQCHDADIDENGRTKFMLLNTNFHITSSSIMSGFNSQIDWTNIVLTNNNDLLPFKLTQDGRFQVVKRLDREQQDFYDLVILCYDSISSEQNRLNSTLNLIIRLSDVNDNCPRALNSTELLNAHPTSNVKYVNKDMYDKRKMDATDLFVSYYTDADIGKNSDLEFYLDSHEDLFEISVIEPQANGISSTFTNQIYTLKLNFKNVTKSTLKLGKYIIKLRIADKGNPSCIKKDTFILYLSSNETKNQQEFIEKLAYQRQRFDTALDYVNDDDDGYDNKNEQDLTLTSTPIYFNSKKTKSSQSKGLVLNFSSLIKFTKNDYFVAFCLLILLALIFFLASMVGFIFLCRKYTKKRSKIVKKKAIESLKVKNYRELELMNSSNSNSNISSGNNSGTVETDRDEENQNEIHHLLSDPNTHNIIMNNNRLSTSFKSNDQSLQSGEMFPRESSTTVSSICHSSNSSQMGEAVGVVATALSMNNPVHHNHHHNSTGRFANQQSSCKNNITYMQQNYHPNNYSNTLKPKMCEEYTNLIDKKNMNIRTLSSHSNLMKIDNKNQRETTRFQEANNGLLNTYNTRQQCNYHSTNKNSNEVKPMPYLTSFPQTLNTFNQLNVDRSMKRNFLTSTTVTPCTSSTDGSEIILVASSTSPTQSSCSSESDYFHQRNNLYHQKQPHQNNLIINDKNNQFNQSFYQNDRIIAKFSNIRQYVDVTSNDEQEIEDNDQEDKMPCLYLTNSNSSNNNNTNGLGQSSLKKSRSNFLRSSAV